MEEIEGEWTQGSYVATNGVEMANADYQHSPKLAVSVGDTFYIKRASDNLTATPARFFTAYNGNTVVALESADNKGIPYTVPSGVDGIIVSYTKGWGPLKAYRRYSVTTLENSEKENTDKIFDIVASAKENGFTFNFSVNHGTPVTLNKDFEDINRFSFTFFAKLSAISGLVKISKNGGQAYGGAIGFDGTNLYTYLNSDTANRTQAHGLTFKDYVGIVFELGNSMSATYSIFTNGGSYTWNVPFWRSQYGKFVVSSENNDLSDCTLSYVPKGITTETWMFGDSYFTGSDDKRWTYYLIQTGNKNYNLNGYGGRGSSAAYNALAVLLETGRIPRRILWCIGMNDADSGAINAAWKEKFDAVKAFCDDNHVEMIGATIPNVSDASYDNTYKNAYVIASGIRYIDFASAVDPDGDGVWYDDMLSGDNIHPTAEGAKCLYSCAVNTVPELLL